MSSGKWSDWTLGPPVEEPVLVRNAVSTTNTFRYIHCPNGCPPFRISAATARNNKSLAIRSHLERLQCDVPIGQRKSAERPRAVEEVVAPPSKRHRPSSKLHDSCNEQIATLKEEVDTSNTQRDALQTQLGHKSQEISTLLSSETRLVTRNDELAGRVHSLEEQMDRMRFEMENGVEQRVGQRVEQRVQQLMEQMEMRMAQLQREVDELKPLVPLVKRINQELGITASVPPAAPIDTYVGHLTALKNAASAASCNVTADTSDALKCENETQKVLIEKLNRRSRNDARIMEDLRARNQTLVKQADKFKEYVEYYNLTDALFEEPGVSIKWLRKLMVHVHPDKHRDHEPLARAITQLYNRLLKDLRSRS